jgi:spermidine/putrescine transport system permease protein
MGTEVKMAATSAKADFPMKATLPPLLQTAAFLSLGHALLWGWLLFRWATFGRFNWNPLPTELALAQWPGVAYLLYGGLLLVDLLVGVGLLREIVPARWLGIGRALLTLIGSVAYFLLTREFYGAALILALSGLLLLLQLQRPAWSLAYPAGFWLALFFVTPMIIVLIVSLGERTRLGTVTYPEFSLSNLGVYFNDYVRFFGRIGGEFIYLRIFWRSLWIALFNTFICLLFGYPFAYWIARQPQRHRNLLVFLVMIPFWTNFLVRTYAWMLILRDSGLINNFWTITLHQQAAALADSSTFFAWLADITSRRLPLLFTQPAVMLGLFYGYLPFMILPLYSNLEKMDWSLLEAAADLGASAWQSTLRVLLPLTMPGIVAGSIIVFIPSLGAYVTPDLMGGARVSLLGNLLQQQFMTVRDWPFGSAIGFIMMAVMLTATLLYFRTLNKAENL